MTKNDIIITDYSDKDFIFINKNLKIYPELQKGQDTFKIETKKLKNFLLDVCIPNIIRIFKDDKQANEWLFIGFAETLRDIIKKRNPWTGYYIIYPGDFFLTELNPHELWLARCEPRLLLVTDIMRKLEYLPITKIKDINLDETNKCFLVPECFKREDITNV